MEEQLNINAEESRRYLNLLNYQSINERLLNKTHDFDQMERRLRIMREKTNQQIGGGNVSHTQKKKISNYFDQMAEDIKRERANAESISNNIHRIDYSKSKYAEAYCSKIDDNYSKFINNEMKLSNNMDRLAKICLEV